MRVFAIGDVHGSHEIYRRVVHHVEALAADALILAGDLLGNPPGFGQIEEAQRWDAEAILDILRPIRLPVLYVLGNDDLVPLEHVPVMWQSIHGRRHQCGPWNFVGYQYSPPFMGGILEKPESGIAADVVAIEPHMDSRTVLVTHCPAEGILDGSDTVDPVRELLEQAGVRLPPGSAAVRRAIERRGVHVHIHGHVHRAFGRDGIHFNVASGPRQLRAMLIELETLEHEVIVEGLAGR